MSTPALEQLSTAEPRAQIGLIILELAAERYAIPSQLVREVVRFRPWTIVPGAPPTLPGIISQRGMILPIADLRPLLGLPDAELSRTARFVVLQHQEIDMALLAESVVDLAELVEDRFEPPPAALESRRGRFIQGITEFEGSPLALLDMDTITSALREGN
ncbi:chemotaxis protein CheW [Chloroflexia bacterium SDU3-3]|nr:chemotaxis protein CheW [Chloroflexia bacterium SDU3-3]